MIFQLSDWFSKPIIWAIIVKFDQIRKNWWLISCDGILEVEKNFFAASSVKKMSRFEEVSPEKIKRIAWKFTKTVILLAIAGYELIITNSAYGLVGYIYQLNYPARPRRITVNYLSHNDIRSLILHLPAFSMFSFTLFTFPTFMATFIIGAKYLTRLAVYEYEATEAWAKRSRWSGCAPWQVTY